MYGNDSLDVWKWIYVITIKFHPKDEFLQHGQYALFNDSTDHRKESCIMVRISQGHFSVDIIFFGHIDLQITFYTDFVMGRKSSLTFILVTKFEQNRWTYVSNWAVGDIWPHSKVQLIIWVTKNPLQLKTIVEEVLNNQNNSFDKNEFKDLIILFQPQILLD